MKHSLLIYLLIILGCAVLISACQAATLQDVIDSIPTETPQSSELALVSTDDEILITPTPKPTATPDALTRSIADVSASTGLDRQVFLGLTGEDWINLGISVLIFIVGSLILSRIVYVILRLIARSTPSERDIQFFIAIRRQINLLIGSLFLYFATDRLVFFSVFTKETLNQIYFP